MMRKVPSLKKTQEFQKVYSQGKYAADSMFVVYALAHTLAESAPQPFSQPFSPSSGSQFVCPSQPMRSNAVLKTNRLGLSVSKKVGCAVVRNKIRRWLKESYRQIAPICLGKSYDIVIVARVPAGAFYHDGGTLQGVTASIGKLFSRLKIFDDTIRLK